MTAEKEITQEVANERELKATLIRLSLEGGAWTFSIRPFSHTTTFCRFANPSSVPDFFKDLSRNTIAFKGKLRGFTRSAQIREQNRGLGCE